VRTALFENSDEFSKKKNPLFFREIGGWYCIVALTADT